MMTCPDWYYSNLLLKWRNAQYLEQSDRLAAEAKQERSLAKILQSIALLRLHSEAEELRCQQLWQQMELNGCDRIPQEWEGGQISD